MLISAPQGRQSTIIRAMGVVGNVPDGTAALARVAQGGENTTTQEPCAWTVAADQQSVRCLAGVGALDQVSGCVLVLRAGSVVLPASRPLTLRSIVTLPCLLMYVFSGDLIAQHRRPDSRVLLRVWRACCGDVPAVLRALLARSPGRLCDRFARVTTTRPR